MFVDYWLDRPSLARRVLSYPASDKSEMAKRVHSKTSANVGRFLSCVSLAENKT